MPLSRRAQVTAQTALQRQASRRASASPEGLPPSEHHEAENEIATSEPNIQHAEENGTSHEPLILPIAHVRKADKCNCIQLTPATDSNDGPQATHDISTAKRSVTNVARDTVTEKNG